MSEVVIALSIEETNRLRQQLGLTLLRVDTHHAATTTTTTTTTGAGTNTNDADEVSNVMSSSSNNHNKEFLELSIDETNKLRQELGLAPLKRDDISHNQATDNKDGRSITDENHGSSITTVQHVPAINEGERHDVAERIERAKLKRQVEENIKTQFAAPSLGVDDGGPDETLQHQNHTKSWAQRMRATASDGIAKPTQTKSSLPKRNNNSATNSSKSASNSYQEQDLHGLHVGHSISELEDGSTTILTLKDAPLLQTAEEDTITSKKIIGLNDATEVELQNIQLVQQQQVQDGLREKRKMELGFGRTGGYVGYDDDEFEELGGTQGPSRLARNTIVGMNTASTVAPSHEATTKKRKKGFQIGAMLDEQDADMEVDVVTAIQKGKAISLAESITNVDVRPSDYMTPEEYKAMEEEQKLLRKSKKSKKSHKAKDKKKHKHRTRTYDNEDDDDDNDVVHPLGSEHLSSKGNSANLLDELDATAVDGPNRKVIRKKRNRDDHDDTDDGEIDDDNIDNGDKNDNTSMDIESSVLSSGTKSESLSSKRERYEQVMAKGNLRSQKVFGTSTTKKPVDDLIDEEPDDAFLNAALEKARRLNRLKELSNSKTGQTILSSTKGAEAVVAAIKQANTTSGNEVTTTNNDSNPTSSEGTNKTIVFKIDETHEFTRTLLARTEQMEREQARLNNKRNNVVIKLEPKDDEAAGNDASTTGAKDGKFTMAVKEENVDMDVDINELAKEVKVEDTAQQQYHIGLDGTTTAVPKIGRGVGGLLKLLQQSGELQQRTNDTKKEEMRGRAKDKRTYEDYEPLDLSKVVRIDEWNATEKDKELASREVKLEYRDEHGRLLTRKEAFRDLSYQFHGYGSGKRKQEKKLQQIAREQAEARIVSQQLNEGTVHTTFGALKETQRATGKAFVIHKTGM